MFLKLVDTQCLNPGNSPSVLDIFNLAHHRLIFENFKKEHKYDSRCYIDPEDFYVYLEDNYGLLNIVDSLRPGKDKSSKIDVLFKLLTLADRQLTREQFLMLLEATDD